MSDNTILDGSASVTRFDAENIQTDKEKARDGISGEDIQKASWGVKEVPPDPKNDPRKSAGCSAGS